MAAWAADVEDLRLPRRRFGRVVGILLIYDPWNGDRRFAMQADHSSKSWALGAGHHDVILAKANVHSGDRLNATPNE